MNIRISTRIVIVSIIVVVDVIVSVVRGVDISVGGRVVNFVVECFD